MQLLQSMMVCCVCALCISCNLLSYLLRIKIEDTGGVEVPSMAGESPSNVVDGDEGTGPSTSADCSAEGEGKHYCIYI